MGKPIKVDSNTSLGTRGKFAGICVEVDLSKPLLSQVRIGNFAQNIEYEGLHTVYFSCGCFGHRLESFLSSSGTKGAGVAGGCGHGGGTHGNGKFGRR